MRPSRSEIKRVKFRGKVGIRMMSEILIEQVWRYWRFSNVPVSVTGWAAGEAAKW
ncbi:MAG: hypothetical protein ACR2FO_00860 [Actinomycetota bacterium]